MNYKPEYKSFQVRVLEQIEYPYDKSIRLGTGQYYFKPIYDLALTNYNYLVWIYNDSNYKLKPLQKEIIHFIITEMNKNIEIVENNKELFNKIGMNYGKSINDMIKYHTKTVYNYFNNNERVINYLYDNYNLTMSDLKNLYLSYMKNKDKLGLINWFENNKNIK